MEYWEVKQNVILANGQNEWFVLGTFQRFKEADDFAERMIGNGFLKRSDMGIIKHTIEQVV